MVAKRHCLALAVKSGLLRPRGESAYANLPGTVGAWPQG
jgi:hypothetical protein